MPDRRLIDHKARGWNPGQVKMGEGTGVTRLGFHRQKASKVEGGGQLAHLPGQPMSVQHIHERIRIQLLHIEHAVP